jgi:peptidyl-prolyl cis-trans isomerase C
VKTADTARRLLRLTALAVAAAACAPTDNTPMVATVGDVEVSVADYRERANRLLRFGYLDVDTIDVAARRQLLDGIIAQDLVVLDAMRRGLDRDSVLVDEVSRLEQRGLIDTLYARQAVQKDYEPGEETIQAYHNEPKNGWNIEVRTEQIVCGTADSASMALAELRSGKTFAELVPRYSLRRIQRRFGSSGDIGWLLQAEMLPALKPHLASMEIGRITPKPVESNIGFHIFRLNDRRPVPLEAVRDRIVKRLKTAKNQQDRRNYVDLLRARYELQAHSEALAALSDLPPDVKVWPGDDVALFSWKGGEYTCRDYMRVHRLGRTRHPSSQPPGELQKLAENLAGQQIMVAEARSLGYNKIEAIRIRVESQRRRMLATAMFKLEGKGAGEPATEEDVEALIRSGVGHADLPDDPDKIPPVVRRRARQRLERAAAEKAMDQFIAGLRTQYASETHIDTVALDTITLILAR